MNTEEACPYVRTCLRVGQGLQLTAGLKGVAVLCGGPHCGKNLSGFSCSLLGKLLFWGAFQDQYRAPTEKGFVALEAEWDTTESQSD